MRYKEVSLGRGSYHSIGSTFQLETGFGIDIMISTLGGILAYLIINS